MNRNKFLRFLALMLISVILLTSCSGNPTEEKDESNSKGETSQEQNENGLEGDFLQNPGETAPESTPADKNQAGSNNGEGDTPVSSKPGATTDSTQKPNSSGSSSDATELGSSGNGQTGGSSNGGFNGNANEGNKPEQSTPSQETETPSEGENKPSDEPKPNKELTYAEYLKMTPAEQQAYYESYEDVMDFIAWYNAAKAKYDADKDTIQIEGGKIDIGEIMGQN